MEKEYSNFNLNIATNQIEQTLISIIINVMGENVDDTNDDIECVFHLVKMHCNRQEIEKRKRKVQTHMHNLILLRFHFNDLSVYNFISFST